MSNTITGKRGEEIACGYLKKLGYIILERNIHFSRSCELDIVVKDKKNTLIAVEVKTRKTDFLGSPLEAITAKKYQNIKQGLLLYRQSHPEYKRFQIDAIAIVLEPQIEIKHLKNV